MKTPITVSAFLIVSTTCLFAADGALASDLEKLNEAYRANLESLQERAVSAADNTTAKKVQDELARLASISPARPKSPATGVPGTLPVDSKWQGNATIRKERDINDYMTKATVLQSDASGFTIDVRFLDREWIYKVKKNGPGYVLLSAEAKSGAGIVKGITKIYESSVEVVTEEGKESIKIRAVRKDGTVAIDATYDLRLEP